ncbi:CLUMA_CG009434, isoform A [Clunio marinus]|uniref:CLUMA_CG009434, isoform A n=1 Tax=Clunio marinus TaxID=568069 RepID=A0A1J1I8D4_9DIPT|nr:CLUMA_CG009434, isoform A [Clunio marinus]
MIPMKDNQKERHIHQVAINNKGKDMHREVKILLNHRISQAIQMNLNQRLMEQMVLIMIIRDQNTEANNIRKNKIINDLTRNNDYQNFVCNFEKFSL